MIRVVIQNETGDDICDGVDVPTSLLVRPEEAPYRCLCFVDPYGDTTFNQLQFGPFLDDLARLRNSCQSDTEQEAIRRIEELVARYQDTPHVYVKLIGD